MATGPIVLTSDTTPSPEQIRREFDLPSGKHVILLKGTGRDQRLAATVAGENADSIKIQDALASRLECATSGTPASFAYKASEDCVSAPAKGAMRHACSAMPRAV